MNYNNKRNTPSHVPGMTPDSVINALKKPARCKFDILVVNFPEDYDHCVTCGTRPAICISETELNRRIPTMVVVPMTKCFQYIDKEGHVFIDRENCDGLEESGVAVVQQPKSIDRTQAIKKIGEVTDLGLQEKIMKSLAECLGLSAL